MSMCSPCCGLGTESVTGCTYIFGMHAFSTFRFFSGVFSAAALPPDTTSEANREKRYRYHTISRIALHYPPSALHWLKRSEVPEFPSASVRTVVERLDQDTGEGAALWVVVIPRRCGISSPVTASSSV